MLEISQQGRRSAQLYQQYLYNMYTQSFAKLSNLLEEELSSAGSSSEIGSKKRLLLL